MQLRSDIELDRFLLFCKVLWGLGSSELCYDPRVFINPQILSSCTLLECPVMKEAVIIVLLIHSFQKGQARNGLPLPERWDTNFLYILTSWDKAKELPYILHGIEPGVLLCCLIKELLLIVDIAVPVSEVQKAERGETACQAVRKEHSDDHHSNQKPASHLTKRKKKKITVRPRNTHSGNF